MSIAGILKWLGFSADALASFLRELVDKVPTAGPQVEEWIVKLYAPLSAENILALLTQLPKEALDIAQGKIVPRQHPSDGPH